MTRRRILPRLLAVGVLVLALAGCVRFQADLNLTPENTVDGSIVVAVLDTEKTDESRATALSYVADIESSLLGSLRDATGVSTSEYDQDDYFGSRIEFDGVALDAFSGQRPESLKFVRDGDAYVFTGVLDFTAQSIPSDETSDDGNIRVSVTFPGEVIEQANGELAGTTVTWSTAIDQRVEMSARGAASPPGPPILLIVGIVLAVLVVIAAVVAVLLFLRSRRAKAAVTTTPAAGELPAAVPVEPLVPEAPAPDPTAPAAEATTPEAPVKKPRAPRAPKAPPVEPEA